MTANLVYHRAVDLMEAELGDELVALQPEQGSCFGFNGVATTVWRKLASPRTFAELRDSLLAEYDVGEEQCTRELEELLQELEGYGLIVSS